MWQFILYDYSGYIIYHNARNGSLDVVIMNTFITYVKKLNLKETCLRLLVFNARIRI